MVEEVISIGLGEFVVSKKPGIVLAAFGLGSCLGIAAYDPVKKVGGMVHAMLPQQKNGDSNPAKFVDTGIMFLQDRLLEQGARRENIIWRYAGGAQMLTAPGLSDRFAIGQQNIQMAQQVFTRHRLRVAGVDTGGFQGRTVRLFVGTGEMTVRYVTGEVLKL